MFKPETNKKNLKRVMSIFVSQKTFDDLTKMSNDSGVSKSELIRQMIIHCFKENSE